MQEHFKSLNSVASSASIEESFKDLRVEVPHSLSANKFLLAHLNSIKASCNINKASLDRIYNIEGKKITSVSRKSVIKYMKYSFISY